MRKWSPSSSRRPARASRPARSNRFLRGRLAPYKIPRRYALMDRLPATSTGKLLKAALKPMLEPDGASGKTSR